MEALHAKYPRDSEAAVLYSLALLGRAASLPPDKTYAHQKKTGELLQPIFRAQPEHPGVAHYIIHAYDYPALAAGALDAARRYARVAPDSPHALHMPSHIFTRLGLWEESIVQPRRRRSRQEASRSRRRAPREGLPGVRAPAARRGRPGSARHRREPQAG